MPLASPPGRPDVVYGFGWIDASGRVADRVTMAALGWAIDLVVDAIQADRRPPGPEPTTPARARRKRDR